MNGPLTVSGVPEFELVVLPGRGRTRVIARGELDLATAPEFQARLTAALEEGDVLLDLSELSFIDSSGVAAMDAVLRERASRGLEVAPQVHENVMRVLEMTGMAGALSFGDPEDRRDTP